MKLDKTHGGNNQTKKETQLRQFRKWLIANDYLGVAAAVADNASILQIKVQDVEFSDEGQEDDGGQDGDDRQDDEEIDDGEEFDDDDAGVEEAAENWTDQEAEVAEAGAQMSNYKILTEGVEVYPRAEMSPASHLSWLKELKAKREGVEEGDD